MALMPWSHRQSTLVKALVTIAAGAGSGLVGTMAHRMGASMNIPYGLVLAFLILGMSTWCARARLGAVGLALHLIASSIVAWWLALPGPGGDALTPIGFNAEVPFFTQYAGLIWLYGLIIVQVLMLMLPRGWFVVPPRRPYAEVDA